MPKFGSHSIKELGSCHKDLQRLLTEAIKYYDFRVVEGHRNEEAQTKALVESKTTLAWPHSKHNAFPSLAVDLAPWPLDWQDRRRFYFLAGLIRGIAGTMNIKIRLGADWDGDGMLNDQTFHDLPHVELVIDD